MHTRCPCPVGLDRVLLNSIFAAPTSMYWICASGSLHRVALAPRPSSFFLNLLDASAARNERRTKSACRVFLFAFHQKFIKDHEFSSKINENLLISIKKVSARLCRGQPLPSASPAATPCLSKGASSWKDLAGGRDAS